MEEINWTQEDMLEVGLKEPDDFLKVKEHYISLVTYYTNKVDTL